MTSTQSKRNGRAFHQPVHIALFLILVMLFGLGFRLARLGQWSFWIDEILTINVARDLTVNFIERPFFALREFPLTAFMIRLFMDETNVTEWNARLGPALIGSVTAPILFFPVRKMFNTGVAAMTAVLIVISPWHIFWSQNARFYILMLLLYTLALYFFYFALQDDNFNYIILSLVFLGLAASERLLALYFLPTIMTYVVCLFLFSLPKPPGLNWKNFGIFVGGGILFALFSGWVFITQPGLWQSIYFVENSPDGFNILLQHIRGVDIHIIFIALVFVWFAWRHKLLITPIFFLLVCAVVPVILTIAASFFQFVHGRYTFISLIPWLTLAAVPVILLFDQFKETKESILVIGVLTAVFLLFPLQELFDYYTNGPGGREEWRTAFEYVATVSGSDDILISNDPVVGNFYTQKSFISMKTIDPRFSDAEICQLNQRAWVVMGGTSRINPDFEQIVRQVGHLVDLHAPNMRLFLIEPENIKRHESLMCP